MGPRRPHSRCNLFSLCLSPCLLQPARSWHKLRSENSSSSTCKQSLGFTHTHTQTEQVSDIARLLCASCLITQIVLLRRIDHFDRTPGAFLPGVVFCRWTSQTNIRHLRRLGGEQDPNCVKVMNLHWTSAVECGIMTCKCTCSSMWLERSRCVMKLWLVTYGKGIIIEYWILNFLPCTAQRKTTLSHLQEEPNCKAFKVQSLPGTGLVIASLLVIAT